MVNAIDLIRKLKGLRKKAKIPNYSPENCKKDNSIACDCIGDCSCDCGAPTW